MADLAIPFRDMQTSGSSGHQQGAPFPGWDLEQNVLPGQTSQRSERSAEKLADLNDVETVKIC